MKHTFRFIAAALTAAILTVSLLAACAPGETVVPAATPEPTATAVPTPTLEPTPSPTPVPNPTPFLNLDNMTDEEILMKYGIPPNSEDLIIGYATDNSGVVVVEYVVDDIECMGIFASRSKGNLTSLYDFPVAGHTKTVFMTVDYNTFTNSVCISGNGNGFDIEPFPAELLTKNGETKPVMITKTILLNELREYLETLGQTVPETQFSKDIEGHDMLGNVVSMMGMLRYFLAVAPKDETKNHIEYNYDPYVVTQTPTIG